VLLLSVLSGKQAGAQVVAGRFPFHIGRRPDAGLRLDDDGVWDQHCTLGVEAAEGPSLQSAPGVPSYLNGQPVERARLHNGDVIELGSVKLRLGLRPVRPKRLRLREILIWLALAGLGLGQVALIYWMES
jgi:pSer/pThr/pTyr-binding forkhead associated (FHA) protein